MDSSVIQSASKSGTDLVIEFKSGRKYSYAGAASHLTALKTASSAGQYFNTNIKNAFSATSLN